MKRDYIQQLRGQLRRQNEEDLRSAISKERETATSRKRKWTTGDSGPEIVPPDSHLQYSQSQDVPQANLNIGSAQPALPPSLQEMQSPTQVPPFVDIFPNMDPASGYFSKTPQYRQGLDYQEDYDAPLLRIMNAVPLKLPWSTGGESTQQDSAARPSEAMQIPSLLSTWPAAAELASQEDFTIEDMNAQPLQTIYGASLSSRWMTEAG